MPVVAACCVVVLCCLHAGHALPDGTESFPPARTARRGAVSQMVNAVVDVALGTSAAAAQPSSDPATGRGLRKRLLATWLRTAGKEMAEKTYEKMLKMSLRELIDLIKKHFRSLRRSGQMSRSAYLPDAAEMHSLGIATDR
ncbi:uncharacterized protein LOC126147703 [Schistocerca cancellata]|uniref:uncharacterized protein LOC126147703 n=1 Tax=Schistocerca cancellata TaxID=274614 RepID=UPI00211985F8|nr:uncharacterized protein LOC126147703 [Schistocerca cancellata]